jgi:hypothetical protein
MFDVKCDNKMKFRISPWFFDEFIDCRHKLRRSARRWLAGCTARSGVLWLSVGWPTLRSIKEKEEFCRMFALFSTSMNIGGV